MSSSSTPHSPSTPVAGLTQGDFAIRTLGPSNHDSPILAAAFEDNLFVSVDPICKGGEIACNLVVEKAGPRSKIFFDPTTVTAAIVTCGGICPGLNNVIRALTLTMIHRYHAKKVLGIKYGFEGLTLQSPPPIDLTIDVVKHIHHFGGSILGSSRGPQKVEDMVDFLQANDISILFCIGGDGTMRGSLALAREAERRQLQISFIGIPKTIDNDLCFTDKTFGFETAVEQALTAISSARAEATSFAGGIGLVQLMGRLSGFVALHAALASGDANIVLIPEVEFNINKVLEYAEWRLKTRGHMVLVVAEGAGQHLMKSGEQKYDASGNLILQDIGAELKDRLSRYLKGKGVEHTVKYINPSYIVRSQPANPSDALFCLNLAHMACHAAMAGKTDMVVSCLNNQFVHIPMERTIQSRNQVDTQGLLYQSAIDSTGMPYDLS